MGGGAFGPPEKGDKEGFCFLKWCKRGKPVRVWR